MKKKSFLLIEVLIALFLVILIGIPLLTKPIFMYRSEMATLEKMEEERLSVCTFVEVEEMLFNRKIGWEKLPRHGEMRHFDLPPGFIKLPGAGAKVITRSFTLECMQEKEVEETKEHSRLLKVKIFFGSQKKTPYEYSLIARYLPKSVGNSGTGTGTNLLEE